MSRLQTSSLLASLAKTGQISKSNQVNSVLSDKIRDDNIVRFNNVIGSLMQEQQEQRQKTEEYKPSVFRLKESFEEHPLLENHVKTELNDLNPEDVTTETERILELNNMPKSLHSGHLYDGKDNKNNPTRSISISMDVIKLIVIIVIGFVLVIMYMKMNTVIHDLEEKSRRY